MWKQWLMGVLPLGAVGCGDMLGRSCTDEARSSVVVTVEDELGSRVTDAKLEFSVDGKAARDCELLVDRYVCGWEQAGTVSIVAQKIGYTDAVRSVHVGMTEDGCHVEGEAVSLKLEPSG